MFKYPVTLTPDGGSVLATFADVPEAITFGADEDETLLNAINALETRLIVPCGCTQAVTYCQPARSAGQKTVRPSALEYAKLGVYQSMIEHVSGD